jgi:hypothetical protein
MWPPRLDTWTTTKSHPACSAARASADEPVCHAARAPSRIASNEVWIRIGPEEFHDVGVSRGDLDGCPIEEGGQEVDANRFIRLPAAFCTDRSTQLAEPPGIIPRPQASATAAASDGVPIPPLIAASWRGGGNR